MGDAEGAFTGEWRPPAAVSQAGAVSNSSISHSQVNITNNYQVFYVQGRPSEWGEPFTNQQPEGDGQEPEGTGQRTECTGQRTECTGQRTEGTGQRTEGTGQRTECTEQRTECTGRRTECTGRRTECTGRRTECTGQQTEGTRQEPDGTRPQPEGAGQEPEGTRPQPEGPGQEPEENQVNSDSDEHKELINSLSLSGNQERPSNGSIQDLICNSNDFDEIKQEDAAALVERFPGEVPMPLLDRQLVQGWPMPANCSCKIIPHSCEVRPSMLLKLSRRLFSTFFKKECMVCLVKNMVCISKSNKKHIIQNVVDIVKEPLHLNGHDLTVGNLVITLPETKVPEWQAVIDSMVQSL